MKKIIEIRTHVLKTDEYPLGGWVLVRVRTEDGIEGVGECFVPDRDGASASATGLLVDRLASELIGEDVLNLTPMWHRCYDVCEKMYDRRGLAIHALSGLDLALHDAAARTLAVPLSELLGGRFRDEVQVYVSSIWVDADDPTLALAMTSDYVSQGFKAIKYYGWDGFGRQPDRDADLLQQIRAAAGQNTQLMLDLGRPGCLAEAIQVARLIEGSGANVFWWEEPLCSTDDLENLAELRLRTDVAIAAGEREMTAFACNSLIQRRAVDLLQPDLSWVGGLTEGRRIATAARLAKLPWVPHCWGTALHFAATVHWVASSPDGFLCEYPITPRTAETRASGTPSVMMTELVETPVEIVAGKARVPTGPGLGIVLNEDALSRYEVGC